jgi:hypothetical protein
VLIHGLYWIKLQQCLNIEKCRSYHLTRLKAIYLQYPEDFLIARLYAKSLLLLSGTQYFSLNVNDMLEDTDSKQ